MPVDPQFVVYCVSADMLLEPVPLHRETGSTFADLLDSAHRLAVAVALGYGRKRC